MFVQHLVLSSLVVDISLAVVRLLVDLVTHGVHASLGTRADGSVGVFGDVLVALLGGS